MSILYRSPNVVIDAHEWHITVEDDSRLNCNRWRRPVLRYKWRPVSDRPLPWKTLTQWQGPMPFRMNAKYMNKYRLHAIVALRDQEQRAAAVKRLEAVKVPTGAMTLNI